MPAGTSESGYRIGVRYIRIISTGSRTCSTSLTNTCSAASARARPVMATARMSHSGSARSRPFEVHRLAEQRQHDQHHEVAHELQHEGRGYRGVDDQLVRKGRLADQPGIAGDGDRAALSASCAASHGQSATATKSRKLLPSIGPGAEDAGEHEVIHGEQGERVHERPRHAADAAEVAREQFAAEEIGEQRARARGPRRGTDAGLHPAGHGRG